MGFGIIDQGLRLGLESEIKIEPPLLPKILNKNIPPEDPPCVPPVPPVPLPEGLTHTQTHDTDPSVPPYYDVKKVKTSFLAVKPGFSLCWSASRTEKSRDDAVTGEHKFHQPTKREALKKENHSMNNDVDRFNDVDDNGREDKECVQDDTVSVKGKKSSVADIHQRHLCIAEGNSIDKFDRGSSLSELEQVLDRRFKLLNDGGSNSKKLNILEPNLKQKLKKISTPKIKSKSDFCSPRKFKNIRDMFRDMEGGQNATNILDGPKPESLSNLGENDKIGPFNAPIEKIGGRTGVNVLMKRSMFQTENLSKLDDNEPATAKKNLKFKSNIQTGFENDTLAKNPKILGHNNPSSEFLYIRDRIEKASNVERLHLVNTTFSPTTRPKEGAVRRLQNSGGKLKFRIDQKDQKQDKRNRVHSTSKKQIDRGSKSQPNKKITHYFSVQHCPTDNAGTRVGPQTTNSRTGQTELAMHKMGQSSAI